MILHNDKMIYALEARRGTERRGCMIIIDKRGVTICNIFQEWSIMMNFHKLKKQSCI